MYVHTHVRVPVRMRACVHACMCAHVHACRRNFCSQTPVLRMTCIRKYVRVLDCKHEKI